MGILFGLVLLIFFSTCVESCGEEGHLGSIPDLVSSILESPLENSSFSVCYKSWNLTTWAETRQRQQEAMAKKEVAAPLRIVKIPETLE